jgi:hypothetical protein
MMRTLLYEAAQIMLVRVTKWSWLKGWAMKNCRTAWHAAAIIAMAIFAAIEGAQLVARGCRDIRNLRPYDQGLPSGGSHPTMLDGTRWVRSLLIVIER